MLKIPKGLKKKKKGKKSKRKDEELFTEEELEQYRREHQTQPQAPQPEVEQPEQTSETKPATENDEWSKFNALTTGVDSILKKTQGDLDRIKSTSFFQRVPAGPRPVDRTGKELPFRRDAQKEGQCWVGFEDKKQAQTSGEAQPKPIVVEEAPPAPIEAVFSESEEEEEEDFDDIFDTSYVEAVEKGEVKLAYVPDSPEDELDAGPDPFDTSYAEKVIKGPEVSKKGKKLVNIGAAVEVLTGRIDHVSTSSAAIKKAKRRIPRDLLLESADSDDLDDVPVVETKVVSLLDDDAEDIPDVAVDLSVSLHTQFIQKNPESEDNLDNQKDILNAFDTITQEDDDDEFAQLAAESLVKPVAAEIPVIPTLPAEPVIVDGSWSAFEDSKVKPNRPPPPRPASGPNLNPAAATDDLSQQDPDSLSDFECDGPDPFDTAFAENILPGKAELKQIEEEILNSQPAGIPNSDSDFDFDPRADEKPYINNRRKSSVHIHVTDPTGIRESISGFENCEVGDFETLKPIHRDLLGGSSTDLSTLADSPIAPVTIEDNDHIDYSDPFDTSLVDVISAPGKTELKFIEKELLGETELKRTLSDPDFDPRAEDNAENYSSPRKPSRPENLLVNKAVIFSIPTEGDANLLEEKIKKSKPVTPYYSRGASITDEEVDTQEDLFDTSIVDTASLSGKSQTSKSILKNKEPVSDIKRSSSNQDLNSEEEDDIKGKFAQLRRHSDFPLSFAKPTSLSDLKKADFLSITEEESVDTKVLTPYQEEVGEENEVDPFDTSLVSNILLPGKTELRFLENELLSHSNDVLDSEFDPRSGENKENSQPQDLLEPSDDAFQVKALTPQLPEPVTGFLIGTEDDDIDPFDTSIADNLGPGKTELRLLESELMN